jgi:hypothetical protein
MNRNRWLTYSSLLLAAVLVGCTALAQEAAPPRTGTADIPFDFYIAGNKLPAGQYMLNIIAPTYVLLRSKDGKAQQDLYFMQTAVAAKNNPSKIIFAGRDGKYYFAEVWSYFGKAQLTSFNSQPGDTSKDVPLNAVEKTVAKP